MLGMPSRRGHVSRMVHRNSIGETMALSYAICTNPRSARWLHSEALEAITVGTEAAEGGLAAGDLLFLLLVV